MWWKCDIVLFCKHKTAYGMRIRYGSSDVCSSDLVEDDPSDRPVDAGEDLIGHGCISLWSDGAGGAQPGDVGVAVAGGAQDLLAVLARGRRRRGDPAHRKRVG